MIYFDSAYVVKCLVREADGAAVRALAREQSAIYTSAIAFAEVSSAIHRHLREGHLTQAQFAEILELFQQQVEEGTWNLLPVRASLLKEVAAEYQRLPAGVPLRAMDALHLVTAGSAGFREIWSNDRHLLAAAARFGLQARSVR
jgi:predicted nucleic acid-binding protein